MEKSQRGKGDEVLFNIPGKYSQVNGLTEVTDRKKNTGKVKQKVKCHCKKILCKYLWMIDLQEKIF